MECIEHLFLNYLNAIKKRKENNNQLLLESLALLYEHQKMFDKSFLVYIDLKDETLIFEYLNKYQLYDCAFDNIIKLINLNKEV